VLFASVYSASWVSSVFVEDEHALCFVVGCCIFLLTHTLA